MIVRKITHETYNEKHVYHVFPDGSYVSDDLVWVYQNLLPSKGHGRDFDKNVDLNIDETLSLEVKIDHIQLDYMFFKKKKYPGLIGDCKKYFLERTKTLENYKRYSISNFFGLFKLDIKEAAWLYQISKEYHLDLDGSLRRAHKKMYSNKASLLEKAKSFKGDGILLYGFKTNRRIKEIKEVKGGLIDGEPIDKYIAENMHDMYIGSLENK